MASPPKLDRFAVDTVRVLVVEDEETTRSLLCRLLAAMGAAEVIAASNGGDALRLACEAPPTIAICDIEMRPVDGLSFLGGVRASLNPEVSAVPVVMFTAHKDSVAMEKAKILGVQGYLIKPFTPKGFATYMCDLVARHYKADWGSMGTPSPEERD